MIMSQFKIGHEHSFQENIYVCQYIFEYWFGYVITTGLCWTEAMPFAIKNIFQVIL